MRRVRTLWRVKRADAVVWLSAFFLTLLLGIQLGIGLSAFISLVGIVARSSRPNHALLGQLPGTRLYRDVRRFPQARLVPGVAALGEAAAPPAPDAPPSRSALMRLTTASNMRP